MARGRLTVDARARVKPRWFAAQTYASGVHACLAVCLARSTVVALESEKV